MNEFFASVQEILRIQFFVLGGTPINIATLVVFLLIVGATFIVSFLVQRTMRLFLRRRGIENEGTLAASSRLLHYLILIGGIGIGLNNIGINLTALFAAGAVFAVAIGFAMQNILQNFVSGIILLVERTIKPGDILELEGRIVRVMQMSIRSTVARTLEDEDLIVPNTNLVQAVVKNLTLRDTQFRIRVSVGVSYGSDMKQVNRVLTGTVADLPWRIKEREPRVYLTAFGNSSVDFEVSVWIDDPWRFNQARSDLHNEVWWALKDAGITIAFPQMDVHFDPPALETLSSTRTG